MYLNCKLPLPININPGMVFPPKAFIELSSIAQLAARLVLLTLEHKDILNTNRLPVEKTGGKDPQPMCMAQYHRVLRSYRRPGLVKDSLVDIDTEEGRQRPHVLVAWKNQVTAVDVDLRIKERGSSPLSAPPSQKI